MMDALKKKFNYRIYRNDDDSFYLTYRDADKDEFFKLISDIIMEDELYKSADNADDFLPDTIKKEIAEQVELTDGDEYFFRLYYNAGEVTGYSSIDLFVSNYAEFMKDSISQIKSILKEAAEIWGNTAMNELKNEIELKIIDNSNTHDREHLHEIESVAGLNA